MKKGQYFVTFRFDFRYTLFGTEIVTAPQILQQYCV
jgi:hypothetical protein